VAVAVPAALAVLCLAYAQQRQWLAPERAPLSAGGLWLQATFQLAVIGSGLAAGLLTWRVVSRYVRSAEQREQRFRDLLAIAADAYWELDHQYRLTALRLPRRGAGAAPGEAAAIGKLPWDLPQFGLDDDTLDLLRAHLEAREPFRDLPLQWRGASGQLRHFLISGEPRYRARTVFSGYWGVSRDVSAEVNARLALRATESRYLELFTASRRRWCCMRTRGSTPTRRRWRCSVCRPASMLGQDLLTVYEAGDSLERARDDLEALQSLHPGGEKPVAEYRLAERAGRRALVRASAVRLDTADGAAALSIFIDDTERKLAEDAVRRSEALLSHLVASSPDVITLSEIATGRYAMVTRSFERQTASAPPSGWGTARSR
jgi:PAS domain-containing protein